MVSAEVVGVEKLSAALGFLCVANVVGYTLGSPIATAILGASSDGDSYMGAILFAGLSPLVASFFILIIRFQQSKRVLAIV